MVFGALIEYACVGYTAKRIQLRKNRFLAVQKLAEEKKAEALKQMNSMPGVELDLKRHGPDGYHGCRDGRGVPQNPTMPRRDQHPKQVRLRKPFDLFPETLNTRQFKFLFRKWIAVRHRKLALETIRMFVTTGQ